MFHFLSILIYLNIINDLITIPAKYCIFNFLFILQDTFQVWDPKKLIRQSRERRMFLFDLYLVFSKEVKDSQGKPKYQYKMKMLVRITSIHSLILSYLMISMKKKTKTIREKQKSISFIFSS